MLKIEQKESKIGKKIEREKEMKRN